MLLAQGLFAYIELYTPPQSHASTKEVWRNIAHSLGSGRFVIHAPHFGHGVNLADRALREGNAALMTDARRFADDLGADEIIVHGGFGGSLEEMCQQALALQEPRLVLENVPKVGIDGQSCLAWSPELLALTLDSGAFSGFVLDIGHAIYASRSAGVSLQDYLAQFLALKPRLFHLADGEKTSEKDIHLNIGKGNFDFGFILAKLPKNARITLETPRDMGRGLADSIADAREVKRLDSLLA